MATGTLLPLPRLGTAVPALATLDVYTAGTTTRVNTYSDVTLLVANTNPLVADANGLFGPIYVGAISVKVVLKTSAGATLYTQDNISSFGLTASLTALNNICNGRLTLQSGVPVSTDQGLTGKTSIYYSPYKGNRIALYDGTATWSIYNFSELSISLGSDAANTPYDVFAYANSGAVAIERLAWTSASSRATALTTQDGVLVKSGDSTRRYLGTYRTRGTVGQCDDVPAARLVWNYYNRVPRALRVTDTTDSWTYTTATFRQANGSTANQVGVMIGVAEEPVNVRVQANATNGTGANVAVAIGEDSTSAAASGCLMSNAFSNSATLFCTPAASLVTQPAAGYHFYTWLEWSGAAGTSTWYGDNAGSTLLSGLTGQVMA